MGKCLKAGKPLFTVVVVFLLLGCKTVYVPVEKVHTDTLVVSKWLHDSVYIEKYLHDSIHVKEKGDSVIIERWHTKYLDRWRDREVHDTTYISRVDTVSVPYPVERKLGFWEKAKIRAVGAVVGVVLAVGVALWIRRRYKRC